MTIKASVNDNSLVRGATLQPHPTPHVIKTAKKLNLTTNSTDSRITAKPESLSIDQVKTVIQKMMLSWPIDDWIGSEILVAVSGGPDSVALLRLLHHVKIARECSAADLHAVHVNHHTRQKCTHDEQFVVNLSNQLGVTSHVIHRDNDAAESPAASEKSLRHFRYDSMIALAHQLGIRILVTAHTADDQVETVLFRLVRGTGIYGLQGIPAIRVREGVSIVRPLLNVRKNQLLVVLNELNQTYCIDDSNAESTYTRNFLRNEIIPALSNKFGGQFDQSLQRIAVQAAQHIQLLDELARPLIKKEREYFVVSQIRQAHPVVGRHALRLIWRESGFDEGAMTSEKWKLFQEFVSQGIAGHIQFPGAITAKLQDDELSFERTQTNR